MKDEVLRQDEAAPTLFSNLLKAKDPETGQGLSMQELMAEAQFLLVAGMHQSDSSQNNNLSSLNRLRNHSNDALFSFLLSR